MSSSTNDSVTAAANDPDNLVIDTYNSLLQASKASEDAEEDVWREEPGSESHLKALRKAREAFFTLLAVSNQISQSNCNCSFDPILDRLQAAKFLARTARYRYLVPNETKEDEYAEYHRFLRMSKEQPGYSYDQGNMASKYMLTSLIPRPSGYEDYKDTSFPADTMKALSDGLRQLCECAHRHHASHHAHNITEVLVSFTDLVQAVNETGNRLPEGLSLDRLDMSRSGAANDARRWYTHPDDTIAEEAHAAAKLVVTGMHRLAAEEISEDEFAALAERTLAVWNVDKEVLAERPALRPQSVMWSYLLSCEITGCIEQWHDRQLTAPPLEWVDMPYPSLD